MELLFLTTTMPDCTYMAPPSLSALEEEIELWSTVISPLNPSRHTAPPYPSRPVAPKTARQPEMELLLAMVKLPDHTYTAPAVFATEFTIELPMSATVLFSRYTAPPLLLPPPSITPAPFTS
eukprot:6932054-Prymnesium_polylepis.1